MREASITRTTKETDIRLSICLDGKGTFEGTSGIGFFDHMLTLFAAHGGFDLKLSAKGDLEVDNHHTVEDIDMPRAGDCQSPWRQKRHHPLRHLLLPHG